jgi:predicted unusual protein kinase regulating ubiquinone biosynthesis (AarF/ABC1/UbiB family)
MAFATRLALNVLFWESLLPRLGLGRLARRGRLRRNRRAAVRFRAMAIGLGGLMIKVGQFLSSRLDVLPPEITKELAGLQDEVPAVPFTVLRAAAEADFGRDLDQQLAWIDPTPLAAASLGQVHRARLLPDDAAALGFTDVVVKVQRPGIEQVVEVDLTALRKVGGWLSHYRPVSRRADVRALVEAFAATTRAELDYPAEGANAETFAANFIDVPHVHVPRVVWEHSSRRVLTLEDVSAVRIGDLDAITAAGVDRADVARVLFETYVQQILTDGFFHADPHPGNLFITPMAASTGSLVTPTRNWKLTFVDFGMVGSVPDHLRAGFRELFIAVALQDAPRLISSFKTLDVLLPEADLVRIEAAGTQLFERFGDIGFGDLRQVDPAQFFDFSLQFQELLLDLPFQLPEDLLMLGRAIGMLSGMCTALDPSFVIWEAVAPYATEFVAEDGVSTTQTVTAELTRAAQLALKLPARADRVLTLMERGELNVRTPRLDLRVRGLERAVRRQTTAVVGGALLITGAIVHQTDRTPGMVLMVVAGLLLARVLLARPGSGRPGR